MVGAIKLSIVNCKFKNCICFVLLIIIIMVVSSCQQQEIPAPVFEKPQPTKPVIKPPAEVKKPTKPAIVGNPPSMSFIHACYIYAWKLPNRQFLEQIRFDQFNVIYLIAAPRWTADDFAGTGAIGFNKFATADIYPPGDKGMSLVPELIDLAHQYKVKVLLCLQDRDFPNLVKNNKSRDNFVNAVVATVTKYDYDGLEVDWEEQLDLTAHMNLMAAFRGRLNQSAGGKYRYLTTAILAGKKYYPAGAAKLSSMVDWINVMTYDMGGALYGERATHNASPVRVKDVLKNWSVFSPSKICVGLPNYGYIYRGIKPGQKCYRPITDFGQSIYYNQLAGMISSGWKETYDAKAQASYFYSHNGKDFITIDTPGSISRKMDMITAGRYRGVFWWEFYCDLTDPAPGKTTFGHLLIDPVESRIRGR